MRKVAVMRRLGRLLLAGIVGLGLAVATVQASPTVRREVAGKLETVRYRALNWWYGRQPHALTLPAPEAARGESAPALDQEGSGREAHPATALEGPSKVAAPAPPDVAPSRDAEARPERARQSAQVAPLEPAVDELRGPKPAAPTAEPQVPVQRAREVVQLAGFSHDYQRWNNCGPVTIGMALSYYGQAITQYDSAPVLKGNKDDKNISPSDLAGYAATLGYPVVVRQNGSLELLQRLLSNGFPVIVETWFAAGSSDNEVGHYRLLTGHDVRQSLFVSQDSYNGPGYRIGLAEQDRLWRYFNRTYLVVYAANQEPLLRAVLGPAWDPVHGLQTGLERAREEIEADPADAVAWFNLGTSLTGLGRYQEAVSAYDRARLLGLHFRTLWYQFGPYQAYFEAGRYQDVLDLAQATLQTARTHEESRYWLGRTLEALGRLEEAGRAYRLTLKDNPRFQPAQEALARLD